MTEDVTINKKKKGSLLLEALLATTILAVSLTLVIQAITSSVRSVVYSSDYTEALFLAENKLFELTEKGSIISSFSEEDNFPSPFDKYKYSISTKPVDELPADSSTSSADGINQVNLKIFWKSGHRENQINFYTYLFNAPDEQK